MPYLTMALKFGPWLLAAALAVLLWGANKNLDAADTALKAANADLVTARESLALYAVAVTDRDDAIRAQNASIEALKAQSRKHREDYERALFAAQARADVHRGKAEDLMALTAPEGELAQCRAARDLLVSELVQ